MQIYRLTPQNDDFPHSLGRLPQPPQELFVRGDPSILNNISLAVVGSRAVTSYGKQVTDRLVSEVALEGVIIVSGLALGVDSLAHQAALDMQGKTIAVLPSGIEYIYPASHQVLAEHIIKQGGAVVSEYPGTMRPRKYHFIARNRIIAGLSDAVLITEASQRSGSLHTAQFALDDGKEVLAVPGSIFSPYSVGTNTLLANGAQLVQDSQTILKFFNKVSRKLSSTGKTDEQQAVLNALSRQPTPVYATTTLREQTGLDVIKLNQTLGQLEIEGLIHRQQGHWRIR